MKSLRTLKAGCGKELVYYKPLTEPVICGEYIDNERKLCSSCSALINDKEEVLKEIDNLVEIDCGCNRKSCIPCQKVRLFAIKLKSKIQGEEE